MKGGDSICFKTPSSIFREVGYLDKHKYITHGIVH
jgi:hypothetical protein